ncbi:MAG: hypothetical protein MI725_08865 [Pirellulales bacterium]|nr:hypothetical protein [Pirellulales bacterium]
MIRNQQFRVMPFKSLSVAALAAILLLAVADAKATNLSITTFDGADVGEGLDLDGAFTHAVNVGGLQFAIRDVTFAADTGAPIPNVSISGTPSVSSPRTEGTQPEYGNTSPDEALEEIMHTIRFVSVPATGGGMMINLENVLIGKEYKLQMLFSENRKLLSGAVNDRRFGVTVEGNVLDSEFGVLQTHGAWTTAPTDGALITYEFTAGDDTVNIELTGFPPGGTFDGNPILQALTLEIPEPATLSLAALFTSVACVIRRRSVRCS